ncbi:PAS domain S-box protein [Candidatus Thiodiazotropha sp. CDECU1]|uniref:PAS domain S-box protein n=1 Tax=Candidatus Thiodiazotropha sp. CDECU1 TaxID=3065865 RepID=UPI00292EA1A3|nr:PAS domain S-box protein [Candidatus Thiodiazotropha sp. CDECU1]
MNRYYGSVLNLDWLKQFLAILIPFAATLAIGAYVHYYTISETERVTWESSELLNVGLARSALNRDLSNVISDLIFLSSYIERQGFDEGGKLRAHQVEQLSYTFIKEKRLYDQVRFIDLDGRERVRVNFSSGQPQLVSPSQLQDKSKRYYFLETMALKPGEIYISPLDLNIEEGAIERPIKPVMRFAVPIYNSLGLKKGILVLNYLGDRLLNDFNRAAANIADHIHLLNAEGYWLSSPSGRDEWGFLLEHKRRFSERHAQAWQAIGELGSGQLRTEAGLLTFETVTPWKVASQTMHGISESGYAIPADASQWKVVSQVPQRRYKPGFWQFIGQHLPLYFTILLVLLFGSWLLAVANVRHRNAQRQSEYERRFRQTLENMQLAAISLDTHNQLIFCNDYFLRLTGWQQDEVLHCDWIERFIHQQEKQSLKDAFRGLLNQSDVSRDVEVDVQMKYGGHRRIAWHNTLSTDSQGQVIGITAIGEDVTDRRKAEDKVRKLSHAVEQSPSIVMLTDRRGMIEYVNPKFTEVTGYEAEEVIGKRPNLLKSGEMQSEEYAQLWTTVKEGEEWRGEFHNRRKNGELYWESASISALKNPAGEITHYVAVKEDITERKRLQDEIDRHNQELARTQALTTMGRMASMIAHDLRNPLSSVKMCMQMLSKQAESELAELSVIALDQIRYMENILTDMLTYARPEAVNVEWVNMEKLLDTTLLSLQRRIDESGVQVKVEHRPGLPALPADAHKLRQLFSNLIVNAIQATENLSVENRMITIDSCQVLGETGSAVQVSICDNGDGLPDEELERLFEPFYTTRTKGTGLGLAIVKQIADQHHGKVALGSRGEGGVCAIVSLPTAPVDG